ncbi:hypothetical protein C8R44DRAFT_793548 [Mycena epipterygia]|nr:hypothetical protein C8R44DRAFT_793548 [Mycena epipterygia]
MTFLFYFHPRDRRAWGAALEHSFSTLLERCLVVRMATLSGMLYQDQASSVSPCATAQSPGRNYALPPVVTPSGPLRSSTSSHSLVLASPFALTSLCHSTRPTQSQLENSAAGSDPEIIACLSSPFIPSDANSHSLCDSAEFAEILSIESALADDARACLDIVLDLPDGTSPGVDWSFLLDNDLDKISDALTHVTVSSPNTVPDEALPLAPTSSRSSLGSYNHSTPSLATTPVEIPHLGPIYPNYGYGYPKDSVPTSPPKPLTHIGISSFSSPLSPSSSIPSSPIQQRQFRNILPLPLPLQGTETTNFVPVKRKLENDGSIIIREPVKNKQKKEGGLPVEPCTGAEGARNHLPDSVVEGKENIQKERK